MDLSIIKELRKDRGMTQSELGEKLGVVKQTVSCWENNISFPSKNILEKLAEIFGISLDALVGNSKPDIPEEDLEWRFSRTRNRFGNILKNYRRKNKVTGEHMSDLLNISYETYAKIENGEYSPSMELIKKISDITKCDVDFLIGALISTSTPTGKTVINGVTFTEMRSECDFTFISRLEDLCLERGVFYDNSEEILCISPADLMDIKFNRMPTLEELLRISYAFNVSLDYLIGKSDIPYVDISETDTKFLDAFHELNGDNKDIIIGEIKKLLKEQRSEVVADTSQYGKAVGK